MIYTKIGEEQDYKSINAEIICPNFYSGFDLFFGKNSGEFFETGFGFFGRSGYIFDSNNFFFGGYSENETFNISCNFLPENRVSYYFNNKLIKNNLISNTGVDFCQFSKENLSSAILEVRSKNPADWPITSDDYLFYNSEPILFNGEYIFYK